MRLALSVVALLTLLVGSTPLQAQQPEVHQLVISVDVQTGELSYSHDPLLAYPRDRIVFSAPGVDEWTVTFTGDTPFSNRVIRGRGDQSRNVPVLPAAAIGSYKYDVSVTVDGVTFTEDPEIIIRDRMR